MALASEHTLDDGRHRLNRFLNGKGRRVRLHAELHGRLEHGVQGVLEPGDHVITTDLEHNSVSRPLRAMEKAGKITLTRVKADGGGTVNPDDIRAAITAKTRLVAITHASNVVGTIQPVAEIGEFVRTMCCSWSMRPDRGRRSGGHQAMNIDLLAFPGHKGLMGPTGTGALYVAPRVKINVWREGGTGGDSSSETQPTEYPYFLEGGTPNVLGVAGLSAGIQWVEAEGLAKIHAHEVGLTERLWKHLDEIGGFEVFGHRDMSRRVGTLSFRSEALPATEFGGILDQAFDIAVRPGLHCAPYIHRALGTFPDGTIRVSPGPFNTDADIDRLASALREILS